MPLKQIRPVIVHGADIMDWIFPGEAITLNTYVGEWPDTDKRTRSIVDAALGDVPRLCPPGTAARQRRR